MATNGNGNGTHVSDVIDCLKGIDFERLITSEVEDAAKQYLASLHCATWGRAYSVFDDKGRTLAASFLTEAILGTFEMLAADGEAA